MLFRSATPHNMHFEFIRRSVLAGKHVLCEKAITVSSAEMEEAAALAEEKGVVVMEAMTIFHMPLYKKLKEIVASGGDRASEDDFRQFWKL